MKFTCNQQDLIKKLNIISKAISSRTTIPTLKGILMDVSGNSLKMTSSDMDITIESSMDVDVEEEGSVVVPYKLFGDFIRKLPNDDIEFTSINNNINVKCRNSNASIVGMDGNEFPIITNNGENANKLILQKEILSKMIKNTSFAASIDQTKGVLSGILIEIENDHIRTVAIDGFRMAINTENTTNEAKEKFIISSRLMNEINKIFSEVEEEEVEFYYDEKGILVVIDNTRISLRMIAGEFIKYQDIIPKDSSISIKIKRQEIIDAIERASIMTEGKNNLVKFNISDSILTVSSNSEEGGSIEEVLIQKDGDNLEIGFNARYMLDVLKVISDEEIIMKMNTPITPCLITPIEGDSYIYLVLPVRI